MAQKDPYHFSWYVIVYKAGLGLFELISGLGIAIFGKWILAQYLLKLSQELLEDPHDLLANLTKGIIPSFFNHNTFIVISLIVLGLTKIAGAIGLIYKKNWGVDLLVGLTAIMLPFQLYNLIVNRSWVDFVYILVGLAIALYLIQFRPRAWISRIFKPA
jgi:uncharacterized membrane protein